MKKLLFLLFVLFVFTVAWARGGRELGPMSENSDLLVADSPGKSIPDSGEVSSAQTVSIVEKMINTFVAVPQAKGDSVILFGQVFDVKGQVIPDALVEIWQTDVNGVYDHPGDPKTAGRDKTFQFFGSSITDDSGWYSFRTIVPGRYEPRPPHIHFKVKFKGRQVLTSQFYFSRDIKKIDSEDDVMEGLADSKNTLQLMQLEQHVLANGRIVIDTGIGSGVLKPTASDNEGPFYPLVPPGDRDNDLVHLSKVTS